MSTKPPHAGGDPALLADLVDAAAACRGVGSGRCAVTAAVADDRGRIFAAATPDSRTPGLSVCALRTALARCLAEGGRTIVTAVALWSERRKVPCGLCRQTFLEIAPRATLHLGDPTGIVPCDPHALLPEPFLSFRAERES